MKPDQDRLLTVAEAAKNAGVSHNTVRRWIKKKMLPAIEYPGAEKQRIFRVSLRTLEQFKKNCMTR